MILVLKQCNTFLTLWKKKKNNEEKFNACWITIAQTFVDMKDFVWILPWNILNSAEKIQGVNTDPLD